MSGKNYAGDHQITISLDLSGIRSNAQKSEKELQGILDTFKVTVNPKVIFTDIEKLKSELKALKNEQIPLKLNAEDASKEIEKLATNIGKIFSSAFKTTVAKQPFENIVTDAKKLQIALKKTQDAIESAEESLTHMEEIGDSYGVGGFYKLNKRITELKDTLNDIDGADGSGFEKIKNQADKLSVVVEKISEKLEDNPIRFKAIFDAERIKSDLQAQNRLLKQELEEQGISGITFAVKPTIPKDYTVIIDASIDPIKSANKIRAQIGTINKLLSRKGKQIVLPVSTKQIKEQFSKIPIEISFSGNFEEKLSLVRQQLAELKKDATGIKVGSIVNPTPQKITVKAEPSKNEQAVLAGLNSIYEETKNIVSGINALKSEGIKLDQKALAAKIAEVNASKTAASATATETTEQKKKIASLNKVRSLYIAAYKEQQKYAGDKESQVYKNATANVGNTQKEWQRQLNTLTAEEAAERQRILDIELAEIKARQDNIRLLAQEKAQKKAETDYAKNITAAERMNKTIQNMKANIDLMKNRLNDPTKAVDFAEFKQAADDFNATYTKLKTVGSKDENGNFINISDDLKQLEKLKASAEKVYETIKDSMSNTANVAKDADKMNQLFSDMVSYSNKYGSELKKNSELYQRFIILQNKMANGSISYFDAKKQFADIRMEAKKLGVEVDSLWKKIQRAFQARGRGLLSQEGWMLISMSMRDVVRNVIDLDAAMTELKKVTSATSAEYDKFLDNASVRAKQIGATLVDTVSATSDFARLGYDIPEASNLADSALVYLNVGDDVDDISQASETIVSTMQGFNIEAEKSMEIVDKYNEVANNYASSAGDIGEITKRSAAAMKVAGSDIDETIALGVAANEVVQDSASIGTAMKTMSMRLRSSESDMEAAGEDTDGMAESVSKLRDEILALSGVDIMLDETTYKTPYQMLTELGKVWDDLSDIGRANIGELLFGKRQANVGFAILENYERAEEILKTSQESSGSALRENEIYLSSIQGRLDQFEATWQSLSANLLDSDIAKGAISSLTGLLNVLDFVVDKIGVIPAAIGVATTALTKFGSSVGKDYALLPQAA